MDEKAGNRKIEILFLAVFIVAISVVSYFHEPWHDEAQAWMIARDASIWEIIFKIPHRECHPPLWHLLLAVFAKGGMPYELSLKGISIVISSVSAWFVLFRSPFPKWIRCIIPFTFFFFYQYGVISRPYCMMLLAFILVAIYYSQRNEKIWQFVLSLAFLCMTSAYGIVFAGGICIVWLWQIWHWQNLAVFLRSFIKDKRFWALLSLLVVTVFVILLMIPGEGTYRGALYSKNGLVFKTLFVFFVMPVEALAGQCVTSYGSLGNISYNVFAFGIEAVLGAVFWIVLIWYGRQKKELGLLLLPIILYDVFGVAVYMYIHHIGIVLMYLLSWLWVCGQKEEQITTSALMEKLYGMMQEQDAGLVKKLWKVLLYVILIVPVWWTISALVLEVNENYFLGKEVVSFLRENQLLDQKILCEWRAVRTADGKEYHNDSNDIDVTVAMMAYMTDHEIEQLIQYADGQPHYSINITATEEENKKNYQLWEEKGIPDVLIGSCELGEVYGERVSLADYQPVKEVATNYIWKNMPNRQYFFVYLRTDLLEKYNLTSLIGQKGNHYMNNQIYFPEEQE